MNILIFILKIIQVTSIPINVLQSPSPFPLNKNLLTLTAVIFLRRSILLVRSILLICQVL